MAIRQLRYMGDPVLRKKARPVEEVTDETRTLIDDMIETMYISEGVGLAANQVGVPQRVIVYDNVQGQYGIDPQALVNPEIVESEGCQREEEGCLSVPEIKEVVERFLKIKVTGLDRNGGEVTIEVEGLTARIIQHEIDHLNGVLFVDRLGAVRKKLAVSRWKKIRKELEARQTA
ncbi:MAG: peptide deformylase [Candidatus Glassbacteria bacterium]